MSTFSGSVDFLLILPSMSDFDKGHLFQFSKEKNFSMFYESGMHFSVHKTWYYEYIWSLC
jgi:hypothetical protein